MSARSRFRSFVLASASVGVAVTLSASSASGIGSGAAKGLSLTAPVGCAHGPTTQAFSRFRDYERYALFPGGDFETGLAWLGGGTVALAPVSDPFAITGTLGRSSLLLQAGGWVRTPKFCVTSETPHARLMARALNEINHLDVEVRLFDDGRVTDSSSGSIAHSDHRSWRPTHKIDLKTSSLDQRETGYADIRFRTQGSWLIDDLLIDPYKRG